MDNVINFANIRQQKTSINSKISPARLRDSRRVLQLSQEELGSLVGVTRQAVSSYERGDKNPDPITLHKISSALNLPINYFITEDRKTFGESGAIFFRKFGSDTVKKNEACNVLAKWLAQITFYLSNIVKFPEITIPEYYPDKPDGTYSHEKMEEIALDIRKLWGIGNGPISNISNLLESKGIIVNHYRMENEKVEAFSYWNASQPFIFMASDKEASVRLRFDLCHELGHLLLHRWVDTVEVEDKKRLKTIEGEANYFAGAFLMPKTSFPDEFYTARLDAFIPLKQRWKVSIQAMIRRCKNLGLIDEDQYTNLNKQISYRKWRTKEPLDNVRDIPIEEPQLLKNAVHLILKNNVKHPSDIVQEIGLSQVWIERICNLSDDTLAASPQPAPTLTFTTP